MRAPRWRADTQLVWAVHLPHKQASVTSLRLSCCSVWVVLRPFAHAGPPPGPLTGSYIPVFASLGKTSPEPEGHPALHLTDPCLFQARATQPERSWVLMPTDGLGAGHVGLSLAASPWVCKSWPITSWYPAVLFTQQVPTPQQEPKLPGSSKCTSGPRFGDVVVVSRPGVALSTGGS